MLDGLVHLDECVRCYFRPLRPPKRASRKTIKVKGDDGAHELSFKFLGEGYLKLRIPREMAFMDRCDGSLPVTALEVFDFVGNRFDWKKEMAMAMADRPETPPSECTCSLPT